MVYIILSFGYLLPPVERPPEAAEPDRELLLSLLELLLEVALLEEDSTRVGVDRLDVRSELVLVLVEAGLV